MKVVGLGVPDVGYQIATAIGPLALSTWTTWKPTGFSVRRALATA
jgi:hypothetical protein